MKVIIDNNVMKASVLGFPATGIISEVAVVRNVRILIPVAETVIRPYAIEYGSAKVSIIAPYQIIK